MAGRPIPVYGPAGEANRASHAAPERWRSREHREPGARVSRDRRSRAHAGHIAYFQASRPARHAARVLRRHAVCVRLRAAVRRHAAADARVARRARRAARRDTRFIARTNTRCRTSVSRSPASRRTTRCARWQEDAQAMRAADQPTLPTTIAPRTGSEPVFARRGSRRPGDPRCPLHDTIPDRLEAFTLMRGWKDKFPLIRTEVAANFTETSEKFARARILLAFFRHFLLTSAVRFRTIGCKFPSIFFGIRDVHATDS